MSWRDVWSDCASGCVGVEVDVSARVGYLLHLQRRVADEVL